MTEARKAAKFLKKIATRLPHTNVGEKTAINLFKNVVVQLDEESGIRKEIEVDLEKYLNLFQKYLEQKQELPTKSPESLDPVLSSPRLDLHRIKMLLSSEYDQLKGPQSCDLLSYYLQTFTDGTNDEFCCIFFKVAFDCSINQYDFLLIRCLLTRIFESRHSNTVRVSSSCIWAFCAVQVIASLKSSDPSTMDMLGGSLELMCHDNPDSVHATVAYFGFWLRKLQQDVSNVEWNIRELRFVSEMLTESLVAAAWSTKRALTSTVWARQEQKLDTPIAVLFLLSCLSSVRGLLPQVRVVEGKGSVTQVNAKQKLPQPSSSAMASSSLARLYDELLAAAFGLTVGLARPLWQSLLLPLLDATSASSDFDLSEGLATCRQVSEPFVAWFSSNEVAISATMRVLESFVVGSSDDEEGGDEGGGDDEDGEGSRNGPDGGDGGDGGVGARLRDRRKGAMRVGGARDNQTEDGQDGDEEEEDHAMLEFVLDTRGEESVLASLNRQESEGIVDVEAHAQADTGSLHCNHFQCVPLDSFRCYRFG